MPAHVDMLCTKHHLARLFMSPPTCTGRIAVAQRLADMCVHVDLSGTSLMPTDKIGLRRLNCARPLLLSACQYRCISFAGGCRERNSVDDASDVLGEQRRIQTIRIRKESYNRKADQAKGSIPSVWKGKSRLTATRAAAFAYRATGRD